MESMIVGAKLALFGITLIVVLVGLIQIGRGLGRAATIPEIAFFDRLRVAGGAMPAGIVTIATGALVFWMVTKWEITFDSLGRVSSMMDGLF